MVEDTKRAETDQRERDRPQAEPPKRNVVRAGSLREEHLADHPSRRPKAKPGK